jgi:Cys-rich repeat protein
VFAEQAAEAKAEGDDARVRRALDQMARRGCRRLQVTARSKRGLGQRLVTGAAAAAMVLSLGLAGCETDAGGRTDSFGTDTYDAYEVAILPADVSGGDATPEIYAILPPPDDPDAVTPEVADDTGQPEVYPVMPPECTTDADCHEPFEGCVDGACEQVMFPVMPQCQTDDDCPPQEVCKNNTCEPMLSILPACVNDDDCPPSEVCADGYCQPVVSVLPACVSDDDCNTPIEACVDGQCEQVMWPIMPECLADDDCAVGQVCVNNACQPAEPLACAADADCPEGQVCEGECPSEDGSVYCILPVKGVCAPKIDPVSCTSDADCVPGDVCVSGCPEGMFCILPMDSVCKTECTSDADCEPTETCLGVKKCPEGMFCVMPIEPDKGVCEPMLYAILPPSPLPVAPPAPKGAGAKASTTAWRAYVEGAIAWFRPANDETGRS